MAFLLECETLVGRENVCIFTTVDEKPFRDLANRLVADKLVPAWFSEIRYIDWVGEHKDLRFVDDNIDNVIILDDYPPYIKQTQKHRLIEVSQYLDPYTHAMPDLGDKELESLIDKLKELVSDWVIVRLIMFS